MGLQALLSGGHSLAETAMSPLHKTVMFVERDGCQQVMSVVTDKDGRETAREGNNGAHAFKESPLHVHPTLQFIK